MRGSQGDIDMNEITRFVIPFSSSAFCLFFILFFSIIRFRFTSDKVPRSLKGHVRICFELVGRFTASDIIENPVQCCVTLAMCLLCENHTFAEENKSQGIYILVTMKCSYQL